METLLAVLALAFATAACAAAIRTQRTVHRLAKALAREWGLRTGSAAQAAPREDASAGAAAREEWLKRSVEALEQRLREVLARTSDLERTPPPAPAPPARDGGQAARAPDAGTRLREHLRALGYEEVALLGVRGPSGAVAFEARREGMPAKGLARVGDEGVVEVRWSAAHRVFP